MSLGPALRSMHHSEMFFAPPLCGIAQRWTQLTAINPDCGTLLPLVREPIKLEWHITAPEYAPVLLKTGQESMNQAFTEVAAETSTDEFPETLDQYMKGELDLHGLERFAKLMWRADETDRRFMQAVLSEPPGNPAIIAPAELTIILRTLVNEDETQTDLSNDETERKHQLKIRLEICKCLNDKVPRRARLVEALNEFSKLPAGCQSLIASANRMWLAEIAFRLVDEFEKDLKPDELETIASLGRTALLSQAPSCQSLPEFQSLLRQFCHLTVRLAFPGEGAADRNDWEERLLVSIASFQIRSVSAEAKLDTDPPDDSDRASEVVSTSLLLVYAAIRQHQTELEGLTKKIAHNVFRSYDDEDALSELFLTMIVIARAYVSLDRPLAPAFHEVLRSLRSQDIRVHAERAHMRSIDPMQNLRNMQEAFNLRLSSPRSQEEKTRLEFLENEMAAALPPNVDIDAKILACAIDEAIAPQRSMRRGIALSGGGFRAASFHLGVLACLADRDMLRNINVLSCVSGGAIAGSAYAVRLKALLANKHDLEITADDYQVIVADLIETFEHLMSMNLRAAAFRNPLAILRMWLRPNYTFTERIAELLDAHLFAPLIKTHPAFRSMDRNALAELARSGRGVTRPISFLNRPFGKDQKIGWPLAPWDLRSPPYCEPDDFDLDGPRNDVRRSKSPELFVNTTALNTGGPFLFSTSGNGEPWKPLRQEISSRPTFQWRQYEDFNVGGITAPSTFRLSRIVAASASVPGLLPPMLFQRTGQAATLALADGGIYDNQGFNPLISLGCNWILASDAAGQLRFDSYPEVANFEVITHSTDVLMERIREMSYASAHDALAKGSGIEFMTLHLTRGLAAPPPKAIFDLDESLEAMRRELLAARGDTGFEVSSMCQRLLANMRTDLDCFSELEVRSLMADGYLQAAQILDSPTTIKKGGNFAWKFMTVAPHLATIDPDDKLASVLDTGRSRFLRLPQLVAKRLRRSGIGLTVLLLAGALGSAALVFLIYLILFQSALHAGADIALRFAIAYGLTLFAIHQLPPTGSKRWLWKLSSAPFLITAMIHAWMVIYIADPIYRRLCRLEK